MKIHEFKDSMGAQCAVNLETFESARVAVEQGVGPWLAVCFGGKSFEVTDEDVGTSLLWAINAGTLDTTVARWREPFEAERDAILKEKIEADLRKNYHQDASGQWVQNYADEVRAAQSPRQEEV